MEKNRKNIIPAIILLTVFVIPVFFDNSLINVNTIHRFLFSVITFLLCGTLCFMKIRFKLFTQFKVIFTAAAIFLFFMLISSEINDRFILSLEDFTLYYNVFSFSFIVFLCFRYYEFDDLLFYISLTIISVCLLISFLGILEFFNINLLNFRANSKPGSTLSIRNFASEYAVLALPFCMILVLKGKNLFVKIYSILSALIILTFIFYCRTRTSFVVLFIYFIGFTIYTFKAKYYSERNLIKDYTVIIAILLISYLIGTFSPPNIDGGRVNLNGTIESLFDRGFPENRARINYWKTSVKIFKDDPVTGVGTGSWSGIYPLYNKSNFNDRNILETSEINPHNDYFEILSENGIFGLIFFSVILIFALKDLFLASINRPNVFPVLLSLSGFLIVSMFSFPKDNVAIMILFSVIIGISLSVTKTEPESEKSSINFKDTKIISLSVLTVILLIIIIFNFLRYKSEIAYLEGLKEKGSGNYKAMLEKFENINRTIYPVDANRMPVDFYKGIGYFELKNYNEALNSFNKALELAPYIPVIKSNIASSFYMLKENENAIKLLIEMKRDYPFFIEPQINLLAIYANTGQDSTAKELLNDIIKMPGERNTIRNYSILEKIKVYYDEKISR